MKAPDAIGALRLWLGDFDPITRQRGTSYYRNHQVRSVTAQADHYVEAEVEGTETYNVTLFFTRGDWRSGCSCPMASDCKHVYAASLAWIDEVESGASDRLEATPAPLPEYPISRPVRTVVDPSPAAKKKSFREQWAPVLTEKLGRPLSEAETRQLGQLAALFTDFMQSHGLLYPATLERHGFGTLIPAQSPQYVALFSGWWDPAHPPADPWALWQYIAYDAERAGRSIPESFRPLTDTAATHAKIDHHLVQQEIATWRRALESGTAADERRETNAAAEIVGLRARLESDGGLLIEVRAAVDQPWKSPVQAWYRALGAAHPADFEHLAPAEAALGRALATETRVNYFLFSAKRPVSEDCAARLLRGAALGAVVLPDGRPFAIEPEPLLREAVTSPTVRDRLELRLVTPDGRDASAAKLVTSRSGRLYLFDNRIWRGPPQVPTTRLPTAALSDAQIMTGLRAGGLRLPAELEGRFRQISLSPKLSCWLSEEEIYGTQLLYVRLSAHSENPLCEQEWVDAGKWQWSKGKAPPPRKADDPLLHLDLVRANAVISRFPDFRLAWNFQAETWSRPVSKNFAEEFTAWHASLPTPLEVELDPELAGLLQAPLRAHLDFSTAPAGGGHDWFDLTVALRVEDTTLAPDEIALLLKARGKWVRLAKHGWRRLELADDAAGACGDALDRLGLGAADVLATGKSATHRLHALQLAAEAETFALRDAQLATALRERAAKLAAIPRPARPEGLRATLRPYQEEGFHFLAHLSANGFGGVLADDMGLGKTVQTLAWLLHLAAAAPDAGSAAAGTDSVAGRRPFRALVVCPKSVTHGWLAETERFAPALQAEGFVPSLAALEFSTLQSHLVVANYAQLRLHARWFQEGAWDAVVLDEGQFIKNPTSQAAVVARALPTRNRLVLTGTPIENRLTDLWSLFAFAQPGLLGTQAAFKRQYPDDAPDAHARLRRRVGHFLLRRTKAQAAPDLPPRTEDEIVVEMEPGQRRLYDAELKRARAQLLGVDTSRALDKVRFNVLASLLRLRQICCHPALIDEAHRDLPSAKLEALMERLEELQEEGHQVLVFSQFVEMLEIIRARVAAANIGYLMLTGATENRAELVAEFQGDRTKTVFLLSLKAAGFGLNLTAASYAILYDPWWNPAVEAQAIDRTHRIGQTRPVIAYRLLAADTVEQKIRALQMQKSTLAAAVVQEESLAKVMDLESLKQILG